MDDENVSDLVEMRSSLSRVFEEIVENNRTTAGVTINPESSLYCSAVLACVRVLSESIASMPFNLYRRLPGGGKEIAEEHPLQEVLAYQPNDWMTSFEWREWMMSQLLLWGNAYCLIKPGRRGSVDQLIPLHASRMTIVRLESGRANAIGKLQYHYLEPGKALPEKYAQSQIFHLRWLSSDAVTGYIPTQLSRDAIALARATELHSSAFFGNGAQSGTYIEVDQPHKPDVLQRFKSQWDDAHRGPSKAFGTVVMPFGFHKKNDPVNNEHAQLIQTRRYQVEEVARHYRVPMHLLGDLSNVRYNTVEQSAIDFATFSLIPHCRRWQFACRRDLIADDKNYFVEFDLSALMAGDYQARSQFLREMFNMGCLSVDEIRGQIGYNPLADGLGDKRFVQVNMQLLDAFTINNPTGAAQNQTAPLPPGEPDDEEDDEEEEGDDGNDGPTPAEAATRAASEALFRTTLRRLAAVEADGILERRNKVGKLQAWLESHEQRMRTELLDAAKATGRDIDAFVNDWMEETRNRLLECHRSGKPYEEATTSWTDRVNLSAG
jgi:HK97 family phage portal protein